MLTKQQSYYLLFILCLTTRAFTSIYYIEDIDSLRFAFSLYEFDLTKLQPHFPGYAVFCFLSKILYQFTNSIGLSFSIIGGLSVFFIIIYTLKICRIDLQSRVGLFLSLIHI